MAKISSPDELAAKRLKLQNQNDSGTTNVRVRVALATCGIASGARDVMEFFQEQLERRNIPATVSRTGCMGYCYAEPTIEVTLPGNDPVVFGFVDLKRADLIIEKYIKTGELVDGIIPVNYETIDLKE